MMPNKLHNIDLRACRVCLDSNFSNGIVLDNNSEWLRVFEYCVGLTIDINDVSRRMCETCAGALTNYAEFKKKCYISNKVWKSLKFELNCNLGNNIKIEKLNKDIHDPPTSSHDAIWCADSVNITIKKENTGETNDNEYGETNSYEEELELEAETEPTYNISIKEKLPIVKRKKRRGRYDNKKDLSVLPVSTINYCGLCEVTSSDIEFTSKHIEEHRNERELNCKLCEFEGRDFADMVSHRYNHYPKEIKISVRCHVCNKLCMNIMSLQFHYRSVHLGKAGGWCSVCDKTYNGYKYWRNHVRLHQEDTKKYICDHCGRHYLFRNQIKAHLLDISEVKPHICDVCGKRFTRYRNLKTHLSTAHVTEPVKCKHCNRTYKNKVNLALHMKSVLRDKDYICEVCTRSFPTKSGLKTHMLWHADERPYACEYCEMKYKVKSQLKVHMRRHTGNLPFKCDYCERRFATSVQRRVHSSVHTGIRAHKCLYCERSFHGKKLLREHYLARHQSSDILLSPNKEVTSNE